MGQLTGGNLALYFFFFLVGMMAAAECPSVADDDEEAITDHGHFLNAEARFSTTNLSTSEETTFSPLFTTKVVPLKNWAMSRVCCCRSDRRCSTDGRKRRGSSLIGPPLNIGEHSRLGAVYKQCWANIHTNFAPYNRPWPAQNAYLTKVHGPQALTTSTNTSQRTN